MDYCKAAARLAIPALLFGFVDCQASDLQPDLITDSVAHACNSCSPAQIVNKGISFGWGNHYVYDLVGDSIHLIQVECEPVGGGTTCYGEEGLVPVEIVSLFSKLKVAYDLNGHSVSFSPDVNINIASPSSHNADGSLHDDGYVNAYDTLTISASNYLVTKCLSDFTCAYSFTSGSPAAHAALVDLLKNLKSALIDFSGLTATFSVTFHDGSEGKYTYDPATKTWTQVSGTARDAHHNLLNPMPGPPHQFIVGPSGPPYDGGNVAHMMNTLVPSDPHCIALEWDGQHLTCILAP